MTIKWLKTERKMAENAKKSRKEKQTKNGENRRKVPTQILLFILFSNFLTRMFQRRPRKKKHIWKPLFWMMMTAALNGPCGDDGKGFSVRWVSISPVPGGAGHSNVFSIKAHFQMSSHFIWLSQSNNLKSFHSGLFSPVALQAWAHHTLKTNNYNYISIFRFSPFNRHKDIWFFF